MVSLLPTLLRVATGNAPRLVCARRLWDKGVEELRRRCDGRRESGAFLLGRCNARLKRIEEFLYYDDVDPQCFSNGIVEFDGRKFGRVWEYCRAKSLTVVADIHVHPGGCAQSASDQSNPMIAEAGHYALILPRYATGHRYPGKIGVYEYLGGRRWSNQSARAAGTFHVGWWPQ